MSDDIANWKEGSEMNFYKKMRNKTTLSPLEVVEKMREVAPLTNSNLDVKKYLQCEKGYRKMKGERLNSFLKVINTAIENPAEYTIEELNLYEWFRDFRENHLKEKMEEFGIKSQNHLAKKLGIAQSSLSDTLSGKKKASMNVILKLKKFFEDDMNVEIELESDGKGRVTNISEEEWQNLFEKTRQYMKEKDMNNVEFAKILGVDNTVISKINRKCYTARGKKVYTALNEFFKNPSEIVVEKKLSFDKKYEGLDERLRTLKWENNYTLEEMSKLTGIEKSLISRLINGKYNYSLETHIKLKEFFDNLDTKTKTEEVEEQSIEENVTNNIEENIEDNITDNVEEVVEDNTSDENIKEEPIVYEFNLTGTKEFEEMLKKYNKLLKKYDREHQILKNYETLINVIKSLQK